MADKAEQETGLPDSSVRMNKEQAIQSLEFAVQTLLDNAAFAREMAARALPGDNPLSKEAYETEAAEAEIHASNLATLAGSLRVLLQLDRASDFRAA